MPVFKHTEKYIAKRSHCSPDDLKMPSTFKEQPHA